MARTGERLVSYVKPNKVKYTFIAAHSRYAIIAQKKKI